MPRDPKTTTIHAASSRREMLLKVALGGSVLALVGLLVGIVGTRQGWFDSRVGMRDLTAGPPGRENAVKLVLDDDRDLNAVLWWDDVPKSVQSMSLAHPGFSNIDHADYAGPESCRECHQANYDSWRDHAHRLMNAMATEETVQGDFSGESRFEFFGVQGHFYRDRDRYRMRLTREGKIRVFDITRTLGSRFQQYYIGRQIAGPEPRDHPIWNADHVLPFGYWMEREWWVPVVHVGHGEQPDAQRDHPWDVDGYERYDEACSFCHNTEAFGDWLLRPESLKRVAAYGPSPVNFFLSAYLEENHPGQGDGLLYRPTAVRDIGRVAMSIMQRPAPEAVASMGITCEACHLGARSHVQNPELLPAFYPSSDDIYLGVRGRKDVWGRTPENLNFTCGRCHSGSRPRYANTISTWNSTEYTDATIGHCYDSAKAQEAGMELLTCVHCHNPHQTIGQKWEPAPSYDDRKCLDCHGQFQADDARVAHTHHPVESEGGRCMNCHMPRINEGLQDMVRTHTIFSPTDAAMIEANQPNACNMCHVQETIDWTLTHLKDWYGTEFDPEQITANYPDRSQSAVMGWLRGDFQPGRLVAADCLSRAKATWAMPELLSILDDEYLLNRQFGQRGIERMLNISLDDYGYRFYMFPEERKEPLSRLRAAAMKDPGLGR